jgi:hypothetical protein
MLMAKNLRNLLEDREETDEKQAGSYVNTSMLLAVGVRRLL